MQSRVAAEVTRLKEGDRAKPASLPRLLHRCAKFDRIVTAKWASKVESPDCHSEAMDRRMNFSRRVSREGREENEGIDFASFADFARHSPRTGSFIVPSTGIPEFRVASE